MAAMSSAHRTDLHAHHPRPIRAFSAYLERRPRSAFLLTPCSRRHHPASHVHRMQHVRQAFVWMARAWNVSAMHNAIPPSAASKTNALRVLKSQHFRRSAVMLGWILAKPAMMVPIIPGSPMLRVVRIARLRVVVTTFSIHRLKHVMMATPSITMDVRRSANLNARRRARFLHKSSSCHSKHPDPTVHRSEAIQRRRKQRNPVQQPYWS